MLDPALFCWPASCTAWQPLLLQVHCSAEGVQSCPVLLATSVHDMHWCCKCTALLKASNPALFCLPPWCLATTAAASALLC